MPDSDLSSELINEVRSLIHQGNDKNAISQILSRRNISKQYITQIIDYVFQQEAMHKEHFESAQYISSQHASAQNNGFDNSTLKVEHTHKLSIGTVLVLFLFLGAVVGSSYYLLAGEKKGTYLLDYEIELRDDTFTSGENLEFNTRYSNMGNEKNYDVSTTYKVMNENQEAVMEWTETKAISHVQNYLIAQRIPYEIPSGKYYIVSDVNYGNNQHATARTLYFSINALSSKPVATTSPMQTSSPKASPSVLPTVASSPVQSASVAATSAVTSIATTSTTASTTATTINGHITNDALNDTSNDSPNDTLSDVSDDISDDLTIEDQQAQNKKILSLIEKAKSIASENPQGAAEICLEFKETKIKDTCFQQLALASENYNFCAEVSATYNKDFCYTSYVLQTKDYEKCELVTSQKAKAGCLSLVPDQ